MRTAKVLAVLAAILALGFSGCANPEEVAKQKGIVEDVRPLVEACKPARSAPAISVRGKALVWDVRSNSRSGAHDRLPGELRAGSADGPVTVFLVVAKRNASAGTYSISRQPAYRQYADVCVVHWPERKVVGMASIGGEDPPKRRRVSSVPSYGDLNGPIAKWIAGLPREGSR